MTARAAVIGAGPSGFYAADQLLKEGVAVDLYDALPTPYGLVRAGVAPDHPKIKSVTRDVRQDGPASGLPLLRRRRAWRRRDAGGPARALPRGRLRRRARRPTTRLGIPGEDRPGSVAATEFVAWYNGHPSYADAAFDLSCERAVVIGNGNVAIDVARMLVLDPDELAGTDTADHAIEAFARASVTDVVILGRRGPAQAAFTNPELRELGDLARADVVVDAAELELDPASAAWLESEDASPTVRRNVAMLREFASRRPAGKSHRVALRFSRSPVEILGDRDGPVTGLRVVRNRLEPDPRGGVRAVATGEQEVIPCGLVIRSIGYRGRPLPGVPFDERRGLIRNEGGRVCEEDGTPRVGEYAVGWIKRGPSGVIGTNKKCAADTVAGLVEDVQRGRLTAPAAPSGDAVEAWLRTRVPGLVTWRGWEAIDEHERGLGAPAGRPRVKLVRVPDMLAVAGQNTGLSV